ncbi:uncharacterized protein LOC113003312 [Solenopsis invicta]|uniref:uncharacterized protein LOC113003312 n=1 Tax=Solenopsis invicta TaxID=13686 RepID=UPI00193CBF2D|nr:uncharacterized protein LOC113003312 [Solenopsis invicta]
MLTVLSQAFPCSIYFLFYISFLLNNKDFPMLLHIFIDHLKVQIKIFFDLIHHEWMTLKAADEIDILRRYANFSKRFNVVIFVLLMFIVNIFCLYQFFPDFLDVIIPLNESRDHHLTFVAEYFVDQQRYIYPILIHSLLAIYMGVIAVLSTGTTLIAFLLHICAMLKIASYRLECVNDNIPLVSKSEKNNIIRERIINAVNIHRRALEFAESILSSFSTFYFIMIGVGISSLTINMFQFMQLMMFTSDTNGMLASGFLILSHFTYMFIGNLAGQIVTDHNNNIFNAMYILKWYTMSIEAQKLLLFIIQTNTKTYYLIIGNIFAASLEGFATLMSMTVSYFTMIYSTR